LKFSAAGYTKLYKFSDVTKLSFIIKLLFNTVCASLYCTLFVKCSRFWSTLLQALSGHQHCHGLTSTCSVADWVTNAPDWKWRAVWHVSVASIATPVRINAKLVTAYATLSGRPSTLAVDRLNVEVSAAV